MHALIRAFGLCRRFAVADAAAVAVEFAFIMPIMVLILIGTLQGGQLIDMQNRVSKAADSIADLIAQQKSLTTTDMLTITSIASVLIQPYNANNLKITTLAIYPNPDVQHAKVCWSYSYNGGTEYAPSGSSYTIPANLLESATSLIVADVTYDFTPLSFNILPLGTITLGNTFYLRPRASRGVSYNGVGC